MKQLIIITLLLVWFNGAHGQCLPVYGYEMKTVKVDSVTVAYYEKGEGRPLLFIHGLGGNGGHWKRNIDELSKQFRCIVIDLPGYAYSNQPVRNDGATQLDFYAATISNFAHQLNLKKVVLIGHSMGAQTAIIASLQHPSLFTQLILISPAGFETFSEAEASMMLTYATPAFYKKQDSNFITNTYKRLFYQFPVEAEPMLEDRLALRSCAELNGYIQNIVLGIQGMLSHPVRADLQKITQPSLVLFGENDALIPNKLFHPLLTISEVANISASIPNSRLVMVSEAGHMLPFEKPTEVNRAIINFLKP